MLDQIWLKSKPETIITNVTIEEVTQYQKLRTLPRLAL
jgi:hypothetical protein